MLTARGAALRLLGGLLGFGVLAAGLVLAIEWQRGSARAIAAASAELNDRADDVAEHLERDIAERVRAVRAWAALDVAVELGVDDVDKRLAGTLRELARDLGAADMAIAIDTLGRVVSASDSSVIGRRAAMLLRGVDTLSSIGVLTDDAGSPWFAVAAPVVQHDGRAIGRLVLLAPWSRLAGSGLAVGTVARLRIDGPTGALFRGKESGSDVDSALVIGRAQRAPTASLVLRVALVELREEALAPVRAARRTAVLAAGAVLLVLVPVALILAQLAARALAKQEALATMGTMAAGLAHEIRTPLGIVRASLDLLERGGSESRREELTGIMRAESSRLERLVEDLLAFARPGTPSRAVEDLAAVVTAAVPVLSALCERHGTRLDLALTSCRASVDEAQIRQVLVNLVDNGARAAGTGGTVTIATVPTNDGAQLEIGDSGPGVPPALRDTLWDPFVTSRSTGTGLGLAIVRRIVDAHDATIALLDTPGRGAHFRITFAVA